jgi:hypothetical protein
MTLGVPELQVSDEQHSTIATLHSLLTEIRDLLRLIASVIAPLPTERTFGYAGERTHASHAQ